MAGKDNEFVVSLEGGREGTEGRGGEGMGGEGRGGEGGEGRGGEGMEGRGGEGGMGEGREGGEGGRRGMTVTPILMAPQYLNNNHVTYYVIT